MSESKPNKPLTVSAPYKLVLLGESAVGKSSLVLRFVKGTFTDFQETTIGAAFLVQTVTLDDRVVKFEIWDTAGYRSLAPMYYRNCHAAVIVYDITSYDSYQKSMEWISQLRKDASPNVVTALVGNKLDRESKRQDASDYAKEQNLLFMETSAKTAAGVSELFNMIAEKLPILNTTDRAQTGVVDVNQQPGSAGSKCC